MPIPTNDLIRSGRFIAASNPILPPSLQPIMCAGFLTTVLRKFINSLT